MDYEWRTYRNKHNTKFFQLFITDKEISRDYERYLLQIWKDGETNDYILYCPMLNADYYILESDDVTNAKLESIYLLSEYLFDTANEYAEIVSCLNGSIPISENDEPKETSVLQFRTTDKNKKG